MPDIIYTVTVLHADDRKGLTDPHCVRSWGWYPTLRRAMKAVEQNIGDMFEDGYYNFAVIELMPPGIMPLVTQEWWFRAIYRKPTEKTKLKIRKPTIISIRKPKWAQAMTGLSMG